MEVEAPIEAIGDGAEVALGVLAEAKGMVGPAEAGFDIAQVALDLIAEAAQGGIEGLTVVLKVVTQALWKRQDPLAYRQTGQDMIDRVAS